MFRSLVIGLGSMCLIALLFAFVQGGSIGATWGKITSLELPEISLPSFGRDSVKTEDLEGLRAGVEFAFEVQNGSIIQLAETVEKLEKSQTLETQNAAVLAELRSTLAAINKNQKALAGEIASLQASQGQNISADSPVLKTLIANQKAIGAALSDLQTSLTIVEKRMEANEEAIALAKTAPTPNLKADEIPPTATVEPIIVAPVILPNEVEEEPEPNSSLVLQEIVIADTAAATPIATIHALDGCLNSPGAGVARLCATSTQDGSPLSNILQRSGASWVEGAEGNGIGETIRFEWDSPRAISAIELQNGDLGLFDTLNRLHEIEVTANGFTRILRVNDTQELQVMRLGIASTDWIEVKIQSVYSGTIDTQTAISYLLPL